MIERKNWKAINEYLQYRLDVDQISSSSQRLEESRLRQLLEWADDEPFTRVQNIRPTFPEYLYKKRVNAHGERLSPVYINHVIGTVHSFFEWLSNHKRGYGNVTTAWLDTLQSPRMPSEPSNHDAVTLEEVRAIAQAPVESIRDRRIRASAVFWFLSGVRVGAFVTLPVSAIDLEALTIKQWPKLGVKTKFSKHATTFLLDIPDLLEVVKTWDSEVRSTGSKLWFASVSPDTGRIDPSITTVGKHRNIRARKDLESWLQRVDLPYYSPHKFRHGHAVYALKNAKDIPALKAVSQNLMHANLSVTDGVYGVLSDLDVKEQIASLGKMMAHGKSEKELIVLLKQLLNQYENSSTE
jgi:integrase